MSTLHVCPLARLAATLDASAAESLVSLHGPHTLPERALAVPRRLALDLSDIAEPRDGYVLPATAHVEALLRFARAWDRRAPLLIHCYAGVSRSTAAAFAVLCALDPSTPEETHAAGLRDASPSATPNPRIVALADDLLGRGGRMRAAIARIGRGVTCFEGNAFFLAVRERAGAEVARSGRNLC